MHITWQRLGLALTLLLAWSSTLAQDLFGEERLPTVDEAIQLVVDADWDNQTLLLDFELIDDVYLYQHRFGFTLKDTNGNVLEAFDNITLPEGKPKTDEIFGDVIVYFHNVRLNLPVNSVPLVDTLLEVRYQGCIEDTLCYPPTKKVFDFSSPQPTKKSPAAAAATPADGDSGFLNTLTSEDANAFNQWMENQSIGLIIGLFFVGGLLLAFTPCVFPMVPILSGIIAGEDNPSASRGFVLSSAYVLGVAIPYTLAGLLVALFGAGLNLQFLLQQPAAIIASAVIFVALALSMFGLYELQLPHFLRDKLHQPGAAKRGSLIGAALMGAISALVVSPCVTPILAGALIYVAASGDAFTGAASLFALSIGMGVPLIIAGTGGGSLLPKAGHWMDEIKRFFGVVMLGVAIWLLDRIISDTITLGLYGLLLAIYGVQLGALESAGEGFARLKRGIALVLALYGSVMIVGALSGGSDPLQPLQPLTRESSAGQPQSISPPAQQSHGPWQTLVGKASLEQALASSRQAGKPVLVDFFAEWCVACKVLEETTLSNQAVLTQMQGFDLYRVDITEINADSQAIMAQYNILGLPALVFFTPTSTEIPKSRVLGEMGPERFIEHLNARVMPHL
ncbi:thiol:disulfide interchange protein DsbD [Alcanivorax nanhaiticus]|uniref:Thiol:disulfide interchange protein DsbD n=1 Tax=Alcanivorax nanhaiticus TaxID=1177154 RepID=A0A095SIL8_9GAMM|nr:protein-disulfide reductase DsbD [Alcanivorax nanhaiticus]KGD64427.1 thiol:disulfide interchange protein DsbD [Alcanivorax nanhaiticus]